ncbi:hypothetical protein ACFE04_013545 [Oxalis oulophora]
MKRLMERDNTRQKVIAKRTNQRREAIEFDEYAELPLRSGSSMGDGEYFISMRIGSPPRKFLLIVDTGSDLTWIKCWYNYDFVSIDVPKKFFNATRSRSFKVVPCGSVACQKKLHEALLDKCPTTSSPCRFDYGYEDGSSVTGFFANETVSVRDHRTGKKIRLHDVMIGCADWSTGINHVDGVLGLGIRKHSFSASMARVYGTKFSYCLADHLSASDIVNYLWFGESPVKKHLKLKYTELLFDIPTFYALNVTGLSIGGVMLDIAPEIWRWNGKDRGGIIIDSGTSLSQFPMPSYNVIMAALTAPLVNLKRVIRTDTDGMQFCFDSNGFRESMVPSFVFHFYNGETFSPPVKSYIVDFADGVKCIGIVSTDWPGLAILGNIMQQDHYWEYEILRGWLGFAASACNRKY